MLNLNYKCPLSWYIFQQASRALVKRQVRKYTSKMRPNQTEAADGNLPAQQVMQSEKPSEGQLWTQDSRSAPSSPPVQPPLGDGDGDGVGAGTGVGTGVGAGAGAEYVPLVTSSSSRAGPTELFNQHSLVA